MEQITLTNGKISSHLCRYFSIDSNLITSLMENYLWFSSPSSFNDPYDCNIKLDIQKYSFKEIYKFIIKAYQNTPNKPSLLTEKDLLEKTKYYFNDPPSFTDIINQELASCMNDYGICCFSQNDNSILMWSHYAEKHKGLCLKFNINTDKRAFSTPIKVSYKKHLPKFNYIKYRLDYDLRRTQLAQFALGTKHKIWKYEDEVRIVKERSEGQYIGAISFNKSSLNEVIFGCKCQKEQINSISKLLNCNGYHPKYYQMRLIESDFILVKESITT
jgi:hypothetical protein